jgi:hypothetical protein
VAHTDWEEAREHEDEYARLRRATELVAHAAADLQWAAGAVGDHVLALPLREGVGPVQVIQAQLAAAAEKAHARAQRAARDAAQAHLRQQVDAASALGPLAALPDLDE